MKLDSNYLSRSVGLLNPKIKKQLLPDASIKEAVKSLSTGSGGSILICTQEGVLLGIFTERDVVKLAESYQEIKNNPIKSVMTENPISVGTTTPLGYALQLMSEGGFRHVPVVSEDKLALGIISMNDVVNEIVSKFVLE